MRAGEEVDRSDVGLEAKQRAEQADLVAIPREFEVVEFQLGHVALIFTASASRPRSSLWLLVTPLKQGPLLMSVSACALLQSSCRSGCYATFLDIAVAVPHGTREVVQCTPPFLDTLKPERPLWVRSGH